MSSRPILKLHGKVASKLTDEQKSALFKSGGLKISLCIKDGRRRKIKKGYLSIDGCECCGKWFTFTDSFKKETMVDFEDISPYMKVF